MELNRRKINKYLIAALALIWGSLAFKFFAPFFKKNEVVVTADMLLNKQPLVLKERDTFSLILPKRDPFLDKQTILKTPKVSKIKSKTPVKLKRAINKPWPVIKYFGFVKSNTRSQRLGLLKISGKLYRVNVSDTVEELKVLEITAEDISLRIGNDKRSFRKD